MWPRCWPGGRRVWPTPWNSKPRRPSPWSLNRYDVRAQVDDRNEKIGRKIRDNELKRIPYLVIVGEKEEAEGMVWGALEAFHAVRGSFEGFDLEAWPDKQLMLPKPYTGLYYLWLEGSISYADQDFTLYNNAMSRFNALWREFFAWCCRTIPQPGKSFRYL